MPLVRFEVRNQSLPELYDDRDDPKAVLDAVSVAGLVAILRQLGDLAEFAGEVFHGLQEQVTMTASKSHSLKVRVQNIEAALTPIEKAIHAQTSHMHFAYNAGLEWHPRIRNEQNHFIYNDLPRFIMDSYEECRDPPRLHFLDRFDTGGQGSCIKRYSDPTFFRRVSTSSNEKNAEKTRRDKKTRKIKKKRSSSLRNGELSRGTSTNSCSGRMRVASSVGDRQASPSRTASTVDRILNSDPGEHSNSFDSRTGSGNIECAFPRGSSMQSEEQDYKKASPTSLLHDDNIDLVVSDEHSRVVDNNCLYDSFEEKIAPSSSCVSWEEKEEIVEFKGQQYDVDEDEDILLKKSEIGMLNSTAVNLRNIDQMDAVFDNENAPASTSDRSELDDKESETDNYLDSLNVIVSESEYDLDCHTRREVEQDSSNVSHKEIEDGINELTAHSPNLHASPKESDTSSYSFSKELASDLSSTWSESIIHVNKPAIVEISSNSDHSPGTDIHGSVDTRDDSKVDSIISNASSSRSSDHDLHGQSGIKVIASFSCFPETPAENPGSESVKLWSNGNLLGLQPSKPPDFAVSSTARELSLSRSLKEMVGPPNHTFAIKDCEDKGKVSMLNENDRSIQKALSSKNSAMFSDDRRTCTPTERIYGAFAQDSLNVKGKESDDFVNGNRSSHANESGRTVPNLVSAVPELSVASDGNATSVEPNLEDNKKSLSTFGLRHGLLVNGFSRKVALVPDHKPVSSNSLERIPETAFREQFERVLPQDSPTSSPPLEHMKISFRPVHGFETNKLKLKFPGGSVGDMFPLFQLVPESVTPMRDTNSGSDDDTFCMSSPYMSDDGISIQSESNSEDWEVSENTGSKELELYNAFCRVSGSEAVSSSPDLWEAANNVDGNHLSIENGMEHSLCGRLREPPCLDVVNPELHQETKGDSDPMNPDPLPPPLPPVKWRLLKAHSEMEKEPHAVSEAPKHVYDLQLGKLSVSQQAQSDQAAQLQTNKEAVGFKPKYEPKINGQKEANLVSNGNTMVEKGDFLHQIRTQSFNLRRPTPAKPNLAAAPAYNVSVNAILEKANAIRQAVASDDGEEDTWSDTN